MTKFKQFERYPTRNAGTALILGTLSEDQRYIAAHYRRNDEYNGMLPHTDDGKVGMLHDAFREFDIIPTEPEKRTGWLNVYRNKYTGHLFMGGFTDARDCTNRLSAHELVGCHRITIRAEFEDDD